MEIQFEQALARLEEIVRDLDSGEKSLNDSLQLFEEGVTLARECAKQLDEAKGRLEILTKSPDGSITTSPLDL
jgi:exodeoxyribonuclease VII small subunit